MGIDISWAGRDKIFSGGESAVVNAPAAPAMTDMDKFFSMGGQIDEVKIYPHDATETYLVDSQYLVMNDWCFRGVIKDNPSRHVDVGSQVQPIFLLSHFVPVDFVDIRDSRLVAGKRFTYIKGDIVNLPFADNSVESLSCLHVAEHIGLGRYGDTVDPKGFDKACAELGRILKPGGRLYFAVPMGREKVVFNAHRVLGSAHVLSAMTGLKLENFSCMDSEGRAFDNVPPDVLDTDSYGVGMFLFTK